MSRHKGSCKAWNALSVEEKKILHKAHTNIPKDADKEPDKEPDNTTAEEDVGGDPLLDNFVDRQGAGVHEARGNDGAADGSESESDGDENNGAAGSKRGTPRPLTRRELSAAKRSALVNGQMSPRTKATAVKQKTFGFGDAVDYLINAQNWNTCDNYFNDAAARTSKRIIIWSHPLHPAVVAKRLIWPCLLHPAVVGQDFSFAYTLLHRSLSLSLSLPLTLSICCCLCSCLSASLCVSGVLRLCVSASLTLSARLSLSPPLSLVLRTIPGTKRDFGPISKDTKASRGERLEVGHWKKYWSQTRSYDANGPPKEKPATKSAKLQRNSRIGGSADGANASSSASVSLSVPGATAGGSSGDVSAAGSAAPSRSATPEPGALSGVGSQAPSPLDDEGAEKRKKGVRAKTLRITELPPQKIESDLRKMTGFS